ncbi:hypothetical protein [Desulfonatronospira sp.]|uniref:hypothetical protein n=1 Tax=Desulfonatronospira sp. TaxID=1962951 RepID=UPI0025C3457F|nr:hypothetical protein [Desulfonatronospira sp.]
MGGTINVNEGKLIVAHDYRLQSMEKDDEGKKKDSSGYLVMTGENDSVLVQGDFVTQSSHSHSNRLTSGILEVRGNFQQKAGSNHNFNASGSHKVILSGKEKQDVSFESPGNSGFALLEISNDHVHFDSVLRGWTLHDDLKIRNVGHGFTGTMDMAGNKMTVKGGIPEHHGTFKLAGGALDIHGDFIQSGGTVDIDGGRLTVTGDYRLQSMEKDDEGNKKDSNGYLVMTGENDSVLVQGDFITQSSRSHSNRLTSGTLEVQGNFMQKAGNNHNFNASGSHNVLLSGKKKQEVSFESPNNSGFGINTISNEEVYFLTVVRGWKLKEDAVIREMHGFTGTMDLGGRTLTVKNPVTMQGPGTCSLSRGKLVIGGDLVQPDGTLTIGGGTLIVQGDYIMQGMPQEEGGEPEDSRGYLNMTHDRDKVLVKGDFITQTSRSHSNRLTRGVLEVRGDFHQKAGNNHNFNASESHKVLFSGENEQRVFFEAPGNSGFAGCSISNKDVYFDSVLRGWRLTDDAVIKGLYGFNGTMDLDGHSLTVDNSISFEGPGTLDISSGNFTVQGNLVQPDGTLTIGGGTLVVHGDYIMQGMPQEEGGEPEDSRGYLNMTHDRDKVLVKGDFITQTSRSHSNRLTRGVLEVRGDFQQKAGNNHNFNATESHKVVFSGDSMQRVSFERPQNSGFQILILVNDHNNRVVLPESFRVHTKFGVSLSPVQMDLVSGASSNLEVAVDARDHKLSWEPVDIQVASLSELGEVTGEEPGLTQIKLISLNNPDVFLYSWVNVLPEKSSVSDYTAEHTVLHDQVTVRALGAWGHLPDRFSRLALDLRRHGVDLLGADMAEISELLAKAESGTNRSISEYAQDIRALKEHMERFAFNNEGELVPVDTGSSL